MSEEVYQKISDYMAFEGLDYCDDLDFIMFLVNRRSDEGFTESVIEQLVKYLQNLLEEE